MMLPNYYDLDDWLLLYSFTKKEFVFNSAIKIVHQTL